MTTHRPRKFLWSLSFCAALTFLLSIGGTGCSTADIAGLGTADSVAYYTQLLQDAPNDPAIYFNRGVCYFRLSKYNDAINDFSNALRVNPGYYSAYLPRADCHRLLGNYQLAISDYGSSLAQRGGDSVYVYNSRAYCHFRLRAYDKAAADYTNALLVGDKTGDTYLRRGISYYKDSAFVQALPDLQKAVILSPDSGLPYLWLANVQYQLDLLDSAIISYTMAKGKKAPAGEETHEAEAYYRRAQVLQVENGSQALTDLAACIMADSTMANAYFLQGEIYKRENNNEMACPAFQNAAKWGRLDALGEAKKCCDGATWGY